MTAAGTPASGTPLRHGGSFRHAFSLPDPAEAWVSLTLAAPGTSWERGEPAVLSLDVDARHRQELILAAGDRPVEYLRFLGRLPAGPHLMRVVLDAALSGGVEQAVVHGVVVRHVGDDDPSAPAWRHAPIIHYRAGEGGLDSTTTDTPLVLCYRLAGTARRRVLEYHLVFSHEDAGTDLTGLLARWGHTVDIEWALRLSLDAAGRVLSEEFQGAGHRARPYRGGRALGGHPVLQVATRNGTFTDRCTTPYRGAFAPVWNQPADEPREGVLQRFPWISRVSALEVRRQVSLEAAPSPHTAAPADPRSYVFLQWKRTRGTTTALEAGVCVRGVWYTSAWGRRALAFAAPEAESTAVKVPPGTVEADVTAIAVASFDAPREPVDLRLVRAFLLDGDDCPRDSFAPPAACRLTSTARRRVVWERR